MEDANSKLNMQDAVKFHEVDSEGRLLALNIRKVEERSRGSMAERLGLRGGVFGDDHW